MSTVQEARLTADDLLRMSDETRFELVDGELVERKMSEESIWVGGRIFRLLGSQIEDSGLGWVFPDGNGFQCFSADRQRVRRADAAVVLKSRMPTSPTRTGYTRVSPNLVVEVVSPHDTMYEVEDKVEEWLSADVDEVWVVLPPSRTVTVHRRGASPQTFHESDEIAAGEALPASVAKSRNSFRQQQMASSNTSCKPHFRSTQMSATDTRLTPKQDVHRLLDSLPDAATWDEIEYAVQVLARVRAGLDDADAGRLISSEEARLQMRRWLAQ